MKHMSLIAEKLWGVIYPIDMVKSRMQTDGFSPSDGQKYRSTLHCVRTVWKTEGISAFTRGLGPTLIRCVLHDFAPFLMVADVLLS
jgi:solute carrier family 25 (mitochondrial carnitine/acylcarnitine transporter), member 20/29